MGCNKLTYRNFDFLEVVHRKKATDLQKIGLNGDHLGNIRLSYTDINQNISTVDLEIVEENNYYPFGLTHKGYNGGTNGNRHHKYMFGGKELQDEIVGSSSFEVYDFGARNYDSALGRWMNLDPLAEKMRRHSPYNYAFNNPIYFIDPDGMAPDDWIKHNGNIVWDKNVTSANDSDLKEGDSYLGKAVVVFQGSKEESLGKVNGRGNINASDSKTAEVTVYGPGGEDDITTGLVGFTMTSNSEKFVPIEEGEYIATNREDPGSGDLPKHYQMFTKDGSDKLPTMDGQLNNKPYQNQIDRNGNPYKDAIFIHRTNNTGAADGGVSTGCLLLSPASYEIFDSKMSQLGYGSPFSVILNRD